MFVFHEPVETITTQYFVFCFLLVPESRLGLSLVKFILLSVLSLMTTTYMTIADFWSQVRRADLTY